MIFTSFEYVIFFAVVLIVRSCLRDFNLEKWFLLVASYIFYMSWSIPCGFLILFTSLVDYFVGIGLGRIENQRRRKASFGRQYLRQPRSARLLQVQQLFSRQRLVGSACPRLSSEPLALRHHSAGWRLFLYVPKHDLYDRDLSAAAAPLP